MATGGFTRNLGGYLAGLALTLAVAPAWAASKPVVEPLQLSIGGGAIDSAAFRWSSALAETLSRPPGLPDCEPATPCGVPGVIAGAQTYDDAQALLKALADGKIATAVLPAMPIFAARCGAPDGQPAPAVVALKILYRQPLYIVLRANSPVVKPKDWIGKTVAVGEHGSDSEVLALSLLDAYGVPRAKVKLMRLPSDKALAAVRNGSAVIGFFLGHVFDVPVGDFVSRGFTLMSLPDTPERRRLLSALPVLEEDAVPPGAFPGLPAISTVSQPVAWVAGPALPAGLAEKLAAAVAEQHNASRIADLVDPVAAVPDGEVFLRLPAPAADGVAQFAKSKQLPVGTIPCPGDVRAAR